VFCTRDGFTRSHTIALEAAGGDDGNGGAFATLLARGGLLTSSIPLPSLGGEGGVRVGTNEAVRWGMQPRDMAQVAEFFQRVLVAKEDPAKVAHDVKEFRSQFDTISFKID